MNKQQVSVEKSEKTPLVVETSPGEQNGVPASCDNKENVSTNLKLPGPSVQTPIKSQTNPLEVKQSQRSNMSLKNARNFVPKSMPCSEKKANSAAQIPMFKIEFKISPEMTTSYQISPKSDLKKVSEAVVAQISVANPTYFNKLDFMEVGKFSDKIWLPTVFDSFCAEELKFSVLRYVYEKYKAVFPMSHIPPQV